jgi:RNA polymerase-binding transcription factor DksA
MQAKDMKRRQQTSRASDARPKARKKPARATSKEILSSPDNPPHIDSRWRQHYERLLALRDEMTKRRGAMSDAAKEEQPTFSLHMADAGTDEFDRDFAMSMISSDQDALYEIESALDRIRAGAYGTCELTGKPIEPARLMAVPWTRFSAKAQRELEAKGAVKQPHMNPPGSLTERFGDTEEAEGESNREAEE